MGDGVGSSRLQWSVEPGDIALLQPDWDVSKIDGSFLGSRLTDQLSVSGETVARRYFDLAQVLQDAFSSLERWP